MKNALSRCLLGLACATCVLAPPRLAATETAPIQPAAPGSDRGQLDDRTRVNAARQRVPPDIRVAPEGTLQRVELNDGSVLFGRIVEVSADRIVLETSAGDRRLELARETITAVRNVKGRMVEGRFRPTPNASTRLFFAPTARPIPRGEATFGVYEVMLPFLQVGVTDWLSLGGGTPLVFGGEGSRPVWFTPKATFYRSNSRYLGAGVIHVAGLDEELGIAYGVGTLGESDGALTVGVGYAYAGEDHAVILMIGGERQLSRSVRFVTENWLWRGGRGFVSGGLRFTGEHLAADVGLGVPVGSDELIAFPLVNFSYRF